MIVKVNDLKVTKEYDDDAINEIVESIKEVGIIHTPLITPDMTVVAGGKRVIALRRLNILEVNCTVTQEGADTDHLEALAIHENLKRKHSWQEQVILTKQLNDLRIKQHGKQGASPKKTGWSLRDTAAELDAALGQVSEDVRLAEAILADPTLARISDKRTAKRIILQQVRRAESEMYAGAPSNIDMNMILHGGAEVVLKSYPNNFIDACVTDPPWLKYSGGIIKDEHTESVFEEVFRVLKQNSFLYAIVGTADFIRYQVALPKMGYKVQGYPCIWVKESVIAPGNKSWEYNRNFELILVAVKGTPALQGSCLSSVFSCQSVHHTKMIHPTEKPPELIKMILSHSTYENSAILDPFCGSGVVCDVAKQMGRTFLGIEINDEYYSKACARLGLTV